MSRVSSRKSTASFLLITPEFFSYLCNRAHQNPNPAITERRLAIVRPRIKIVVLVYELTVIKFMSKKPRHMLF